MTKDGKIVERENVELETVKVEEIPQASGDLLKVNEVPDQKNQVASGTLKMEEETEEVEPIPADATKEDEDEIEIELGKKMEEMSYRIEEMEKKMKMMEEAMMPPVDQEVNQEVAGIKMEEEELPKLDGAPIEEGLKFAADNRKNYGKKTKDAQSSFLSKLYN
jgi:hypothetical protein